MEKKLFKGNQAIAEAAIQAGCRYYFGYPITPQNEIGEYMSKALPQVSGTFIQAESEVGAINMVYGAAACGVRVMTSSSGLGIALKQEGISNLCGAEVPAVIVNICRAGPGLGSIGPSQADYNQMTRGGGPGDYHMIVYAPETVQEMVHLTQEAFRKADEYRNPTAILADGILGQMMASVHVPGPDELPAVPEKKLSLGQPDKRAYFSSLRTNNDELEQHNLNLQKKYELIKQKEARIELRDVEDADILLVAYGICARVALKVQELAKADGIRVGIARPITVWPFPYDELFEASKDAKAVLCIEMSDGQMMNDVKLALKGSKPIELYSKFGGNLPDTKQVYEQVKKVLLEVR
jgi:2-oxoglutarate ferredoxin oxidoreductase subunit alpha